jgi:hypothetical protein
MPFSGVRSYFSGAWRWRWSSSFGCCCFLLNQSDTVSFFLGNASWHLEVCKGAFGWRRCMPNRNCGRFLAHKLNKNVMAARLWHAAYLERNQIHARIWARKLWHGAASWGCQPNAPSYKPSGTPHQHEQQARRCRQQHTTQ